MKDDTAAALAEPTTLDGTPRPAEAADEELPAVELPFQEELTADQADAGDRLVLGRSVAVRQERKRPGPAKQFDKKLAMLTTEQWAWLTAKASETGTNKQAVLRDAVAAYMIGAEEHAE